MKNCTEDDYIIAEFIAITDAFVNAGLNFVSFKETVAFSALWNATYRR
jgi:hypothetical protein